MLSRSLYEHGVFPVYHWIKRDYVNRARAELRRSEWFSEDQLMELQQAKLLRLLQFAFEHVPYYRDIMKAAKLTPEEITEKDRIRDLPTLTKDIIRQQGDKMWSSDLRGNKLIKNSTSGST